MKLVLLAAALVVVLAGCSSPPSDCVAAVEWHREQAAYASNETVSAWHEWKAKQYEALVDEWDSDPADCRDWMAYRDPPGQVA